MNKTNFKKLFAGDRYSVRPSVKIKVLFSNGYLIFNTHFTELGNIRKSIHKYLRAEDFKKIISIEY